MASSSDKVDVRMSLVPACNFLCLFKRLYSLDDELCLSIPRALLWISPNVVQGVVLVGQVSCPQEGTMPDQTY